ncbi:MAG: hypothetical protein DI537_14730 [Stutzerimonas stutzeri]|nr:MAG: hypothetical protein DI537_14730 [Stutzerimonas stutzeri]
MSQTTRFAMLAPTNQFSFTCPIFQVDVKMRQCVKLVETTKVNQKLEVRRGCQACIRSSKCPVDLLSRMISFSAPGIEPSDYGSSEPSKGRLDQHILKRIAPVMVLPRTLDEMGVPQAERDLIQRSHDALMKAMPSYSDERSAEKPKRRRAARTEEPLAKSATTTRVNQAAESGDMAAAI